LDNERTFCFVVVVVERISL